MPPTPIESERAQRLAHARRLQSRSAPLEMGTQAQPPRSLGTQNEAASSAPERPDGIIPGDSATKALGAAAGEVTDIMQTVREQGIPAAMKKIGASYLQILALAAKEIGKRTLGADFGLLFFFGANLQLLLMLAGKPMKKLPMELWELVVILFLDIAILFLVLSIAGFIAGMVSYVKQHPLDAMWSIFFGPFDLIEDIIP